MVTKKELYQKFCQENNVPIFMNPWWLDAVCENDSWDCALVEKGDTVVAAMPYVRKKKGVFTFIGMPKLTPYLGPWVVYPEGQKPSSKLAFEKEVYKDLISKLPKYDKLNLALPITVTNWLPFYWKGYQQTTRYTYIIKPDSISKAYSNLRANIRREIKKAEKRLTIKELSNLKDFYEVNSLTFKRQKIKAPHSFKFLETLDQVLKKVKGGKKMMALDQEKKIHSVSYFVWDSNSVYFLMGGSDPDLRNSGAASLLMWEGIKLAMETKKDFNFEGSMIEPVERFFRAFGGNQIPYFKIFRYNSNILKMKQILY